MSDNQLGEIMAYRFLTWNLDRIRRWMDERLDFHANEIVDDPNYAYNLLFEEFYESYEVEIGGRKLCDHVDEDLQYMEPSVTHAFYQSLKESFETLLTEVLDEWLVTGGCR